MMFNKGKGRFSDPKHIRRARAYLEEARMAMLEHSIAAEHYQAMTAMYAQRVQRLERDIAAWEAGESLPAQPLRAAPEAAVAEPVAAAKPRASTSGIVMPMPGGEQPPDPRRAA